MILITTINPGMDAVLGLYDESYDYNTRVGAVSEEDPAVYTVRENDSLQTIAVRYYADETRWSVIFKENRKKISNPDMIYEGQQLVIPLP